MATAVALIHEEDGVLGISFPDFPGVVSTGRREDEVLRKGAEALSFHVAGMIEDGEAVPVPRSLFDLRHDHAYQEASEGAQVAFVPFEAARGLPLSARRDLSP